VERRARASGEGEPEMAPSPPPEAPKTRPSLPRLRGVIVSA